MAKLNQIVALEKGTKGRTAAYLTTVHHQLQRNALFAGLSRVYYPKHEDGDTFPPEKTLVQATVIESLDEASQQLENLFNVVATKEWGNVHAKADVVVDGTTLIEGAPVPYLLFLEKELTNWRTLVTKLPLLDPAEVWTYDEDNGHFRTEPTRTTKTKKVPKVLTKAPATDKHPAQTEVYMEDIVVGEWATTKFSGAISAKRRDELVERANKLLDAVKSAREEANGIEVTQQKVADQVFAFLLG